MSASDHDAHVNAKDNTCSKCGGNLVATEMSIPDLKTGPAPTLFCEKCHHAFIFCVDGVAEVTLVPKEK